ncbi:MAG: isopentenyl-diphosphate Delta-isomerase [Pseudomonadota bacterium]
MMADIPAWIDGKLQPADKLETHLEGWKHKAVSVFALRGGETLIQRRALGKYHTPGLWANTCCTHPHWGEDPATCAVRRLEEELGITGLHPVHRDVIEYRADVGGGMIEHEVVDLFIAVAPSTMKMKPNPNEVMDTEWVDLHELCARVERYPERFTPWLRIYLAEHSERIFGALVRA